MTPGYASPSMRDEFLRALDDSDHSRSVVLAKDLTQCAHPLPGLTCQQLDLPPGSTYATAAERVLELYSAPA
jgi:hypothetical protein